MHNTKPTHGTKNIDVLVSDMVHLYRESNIVQNVPTNIPDGQPGGGKQSDHSVAYCQPRLESLSKPVQVLVFTLVRGDPFDLGGV